MKVLGKARGILLVFSYLVVLVWCRSIKVNCPDYCDCDIFQKLKRATCQNRKLISIELNIPKKAQILDVSQNHISELGDKIFQDLGLSNLKLLNLSHNALRQIHFNAFQGMAKLKTLDLSYNAIEYLIKSWFENWRSLEELYLRGNNLRSINEQPRIAINSLKVLDLASCGITSLKTDIFELVPNLKMLDISQNYIQVVHVKLLQYIPKLVEFRTEGNPFNCYLKGLSDVRNYTQAHSVLYTDVCADIISTPTSTNKGVRKFEKIVMATDGVVEDNNTVTNKNNSWILDDSEEDISETKFVNICQNQTREFTSDDDDETLLMRIIQLSPWLVTTIIFIYGVLFGMVISCFVKLCWNPRRIPRTPKNIQNNQDRLHNNHKARRTNSVLYKSLQKNRLSMFQHNELEDDDDEWDDTLMMNEVALANSTPVFQRRH